MAGLQKIKDFIFANDIEEYELDENYYEEEPKLESKLDSRRVEDPKQSNILSMPNIQKNAVVISTPKNIDDASSIVRHLLDLKICLVNLEGVEQQEAQRIADFLGGAVYAVKGEIEKISCDIFIVAPTNVDISGSIENTIRESSVLPWFK